MKSCPNCLSESNGNFCHSCGQKFLETPYTFKTISILISDIIDYNKSFFATFYHLILRPRVVIETYLNGNTKLYVSPFKYFFLLLTILFLTTLTDEEYLTYFISIPLVLYFWGMNFLLFKESKFNFFEHLLIAMYELTEFFLLTPISLLIQFALVRLNIVKIELSDAVLVVAWTLLILGYHAHFSIQVFHGNKLLKLLKAVIVIVVGFVLTGLIVGEIT